MISITPQTSQNIHRGTGTNELGPEFFFEDIATRQSFRDILMSSVLGQGGESVAPSFDVKENGGTISQITHSSSQYPTYMFQQIDIERTSADRFDMTGVLGHFHAISDQASATMEVVPPVDDIEFIEQLDIELSLNFDQLESLSTNETNQSSKEKSVIPLTKGKVTQTNFQLKSSSKPSKNTIDISQNVEADVMSPTLDIATELSDGEAEIHRNSVKTPVQSLLNTSSFRAHSNQLMVALQTLENGLRLYARVQNMSLEEQGELREGAKNLLRANGFSGVEVVIDQFDLRKIREKD